MQNNNVTIYKMDRNTDYTYEVGNYALQILFVNSFSFSYIRYRALNISFLLHEADYFLKS
jgi:hypothetical protein